MSMRKKRRRGKDAQGIARARSPGMDRMAARAYARWDGDVDASPFERERLAKALMARAREAPTRFRRWTREGEAMADVFGLGEEFKKFALAQGKSLAWVQQHEQWQPPKAPWSCLDRPGLRPGFHGALVESWEREGDQLRVEFNGYFDPEGLVEGGSRLLLIFTAPSVSILEGGRSRAMDAQGTWGSGDEREFIDRGVHRGALDDLARVGCHELSGQGEPLALRLRFWDRWLPLEIEIVGQSAAAHWGDQDIGAARALIEARALAGALGELVGPAPSGATGKAL